MEWLLGLAFLPLLLCGLMCAVPMVLAAVGLRRRASRRASCDEPSVSSAADEDQVTAKR